MRAGTVVSLAAAWVLLGSPASAGEAAAMRMYADPQTGKVGAPPPAALKSAEDAAVTVQEAAPAPAPEAVTTGAGGMKVDLRGRYSAAVTRRADSPPGSHECVQSSSPAP